MSELKYNEPAERFAPTVEKSLYANVTAVMVSSEDGCWVHYAKYCERISNIKSEADKVIAELEESHKMEVEQLLMEIAELKDKLQNVSATLKETREWLVESQKLHKRCSDNAVKVIRHQKYKRCLAMANWCASEAYIHEHGSDYDEDLVAWFGKWHKRWLELANKFKEASRGTH